jgi:hypothetical protein
MVPIGKNLAGTTNPIGTGTGIGRNWIKKGSGIGNSPEFSGIPLGIHNQGLQHRPWNYEWRVLRPSPSQVKRTVSAEKSSILPAPATPTYVLSRPVSPECYLRLHSAPPQLPWHACSTPPPMSLQLSSLIASVRPLRLCAQTWASYLRMSQPVAFVPPVGRHCSLPPSRSGRHPPHRPVALGRNAPLSTHPSLSTHEGLLLSHACRGHVHPHTQPPLSTTRMTPPSAPAFRIIHFLSHLSSHSLLACGGSWHDSLPVTRPFRGTKVELLLVKSPVFATTSLS